MLGQASTRNDQSPCDRMRRRRTVGRVTSWRWKVARRPDISTSLRCVMDSSTRDTIFGRVLASRVLQNVVLPLDVVTISQALWIYEISIETTRMPKLSMIQTHTYLMAGRTSGRDGISGLPSKSLKRRLRAPMEEAQRKTCAKSLGIEIARILLLTSDRQKSEVPLARKPKPVFGSLRPIFQFQWQTCIVDSS